MLVMKLQDRRGKELDDNCNAGWMDGWVDEWMDGQMMDRWIDGQMDG